MDDQITQNSDNWQSGSGNKTNDINNSATTSNDDFDDIMETYKKRLLEELGLKDTSQEERREIEEKIATLVNDRIINLVLIYLPEDKVSLLDQKLQSASQAELMEFIADSIPGIGEKIANELLSIRDELINLLKKK